MIGFWKDKYTGRIHEVFKDRHRHFHIRQLILGVRSKAIIMPKHQIQFIIQDSEKLENMGKYTWLVNTQNHHHSMGVKKEHYVMLAECTKQYLETEAGAEWFNKELEKFGIEVAQLSIIEKAYEVVKGSSYEKWFHETYPQHIGLDGISCWDTVARRMVNIAVCDK